MTARPIHTAPRAIGLDEEPVAILLYCPDQGGWFIGAWVRAGTYEGAWLQQGWRQASDHTVELQPTHWLPCSPWAANSNSAATRRGHR